MNIKEFKEGDIITRNEPVVYQHSGETDGSYIGDRLIFKGYDDNAKIIFFIIDEFNEITSLSYARNKWDEGWCYYPETLYQKAKKSLLGKLNKEGGEKQ